MAATRPRTLVELGVYSGISYLAFCQAAVQHGVPLRAWGVDTWQGDAHAGHYGQRVLDTLRQQHDGPYAHFSTLLQKTFDEALDDVADSSVDLLHIDGLHTYEAVRHDFESWSPKLSRRAVVLFHDIAVRQEDFGVWRFWAEITQRYPSLAFGHSNGLGVLLAGPQAPAELLALTRDTARWQAARAAFAVLGERFELRARCQHLQAELAGEQARSQARHEWIGQQDAQLLAASRAVEQAAGWQRAAEQAAERAISQQRAAEQAAERAARQAREDQKESEVRLRQAAQALHAARAGARTASASGCHAGLAQLARHRRSALAGAAGPPAAGGHALAAHAQRTQIPAHRQLARPDSARAARAAAGGGLSSKRWAPDRSISTSVPCWTGTTNSAAPPAPCPWDKQKKRHEKPESDITWPLI